MKKKLLLLSSYILVSALTAALTMGLLFWQTGGVSKLDQLQALIEQCYIGEADPVALEDAAAEAMIAATGDRWSYYIPASEYESYLETARNAYVGIGITITVAHDGSGLEVLEVLPGSSAQEAGIQVGDVITAIEGRETADMTTTQARDLVRGLEGTPVQITLWREGQTLELTVTRRKVEVEVATGQLLGEDTGLVTIYNFDDRCASESIAAIEDLMAQGAEQLIFDVRSNPGGFAHELVALLDYLLPEGELFRTVDYLGQESVDMSDENYLDLPMVVLVNGDSYSAAEFFAVALQEYEAAQVVGEQTTGKGHFQTTFQLKDGSAVALSIGKYFTPGGVSLEGVGITPDVEVMMPVELEEAFYYGTLDPMEDPQILAALEILK